MLRELIQEQAVKEQVGLQLHPSSVPVIRAAEDGIGTNGRGLLCCLPGVGPFVGSDVTADLIYAGMHTTSVFSGKVLTSFNRRATVDCATGCTY